MFSLTEQQVLRVDTIPKKAVFRESVALPSGTTLELYAEHDKGRPVSADRLFTVPLPLPLGAHLYMGKVHIKSSPPLADAAGLVSALSELQRAVPLVTDSSPNREFPRAFGQYDYEDCSDAEPDPPPDGSGDDTDSDSEYTHCSDPDPGYVTNDGDDGLTNDGDECDLLDEPPDA